MHTRRNFLVSLAFFSLFSGCRQNESGIAILVLKTSDNPFFRDLEEGVREEWKNVDKPPELHVRAGQSEGDVSTQRQVLDDYFARYAEDRDTPLLRAVFITPSASGPELTDHFQKLQKAKIPVIVIDTRIDGSDFDVFVGSSNKDGGELAAQILSKEIPDGGEILLLNGVDGQETAAARNSGFKEGLAKSPNSIEYSIIERTCNWRREEARSTVDSLLTLGKAFDAVFAANDEMALGVVEAYRQRPDLKRPPIIGFDATEDARQAVDAGELTATIAQDPRSMGVMAVQAAAKIWASQPVEREQTIPVKAVGPKTN